MKNSVLWDIRKCSPLKIIRWFGGTCPSACELLHAGLLLDIFFDPADGGNIFVRNIS
jgi:hypothetical protein